MRHGAGNNIGAVAVCVFEDTLEVVSGSAAPEFFLILHKNLQRVYQGAERRL
jgi:hypothetical protein